MSRNLFKEHISLELIKHAENDPAVLEIDKIHADIIKYIEKNLIYKTNKPGILLGDADAWLLNKDKGIIPLLENIAKVIYRRFGLTVTINPTYVMMNACTIPFYIRESNVLSKLEGFPHADKFIEGKIAVLNKMLNNPNLRKGVIDHDNAKVSGPLSLYINSLNIDYVSFVKLGKFTPRELTAILLHEVGHMFTYMQTAVRTDKTNQILNDISNSIKNKEPAGKREYLLVNLLNEGMLTDKEVQELAKEERPIILGTKLFSFIYKRYIDYSISLQYSQTSSETLADNFAAKLGYGKELATSLRKMDDWFIKATGIKNPRDCYEDIVIPFAIWYLLTYAIVSIINLIPGLYENLLRFLYKIRYDLTKRSYMVYDTERYRVKRIMQIYIDRLKDPKLKRNNVLSTITDIKQIEKIMNSYDDDDQPIDWVNKAVLLFSSETRDIEKEIHIERMLEELANNPLFISAKELQYSKEEFYKGIFPSSKEDNVSIEARGSTGTYHEVDRTGFDRAYKKAESLYNRKDNISLAIPDTPSFSNTAQATIVIADKARVTKDTVTIGSKTLVNLLTGSRYITAKSILDYSILDKAEPYFLKFIDVYLSNIQYDENGRYIEPKDHQLTIGKAIEDFCKNVIGFKEYAYGIARLGLCYNLPSSMIDSVNRSKIKLVIEGDFTKNDIDRLYNALASLKDLVKKNFSSTEKDIGNRYSSKYEAKHKKYAVTRWLPELMEKCKCKTKDQLRSIASEAVVYSWGFANNMYGYIMHYFNMMYMTLSAIEKKISKKISKEWWFSSNDNKSEHVETPKEDISYETILNKITAIKESNNPPISKNGYTVVHNKKCGLLLADKATIANNEIVISSNDLIKLITGPRLKALKDVLSNDPLSRFKPQMKKFIDIYASNALNWNDKVVNDLSNIVISFSSSALGIKDFAYKFSPEISLNTNVNPTYTACSNAGNIRITGNFSTSDINALYNTIVSLKANIAKYKENTAVDIYTKNMYKEIEAYTYAYVDKLESNSNYNKREAYKTLEYVVMSMYAFPWLLDEYVDSYLSLLNLAISAIGNKAISKESVEINLGLELIKHFHDDPLGPSIDKVHEEIKKIVLAVPDEHEMRRMIDQGVLNPYLSKIEDIVKKRLGISIALCSFPDLDFAFCIPYYIRPDMVLMTNEESKDTLGNKTSARRYARSRYLSEGTIDYERCKISGVLSNYNHIVSIDYFALFKYVHCNAREATGVLLHELGHLFTYIDAGYRTDKTNQILNHISNSLLNKEPASKRTFLLAELKDLDMVDKDLLEQLAKEERPMILSLNIFKALFNKVTNVSISNDYTDTSSEVVADDFATKFGYGQDIAMFLHRTERMFGPKKLVTTDLGKWFKMIAYLVIGTTIFYSSPLAIMFTYCTSVALAEKLLERLKRGYMDVFFNKMDVNYDIMITRLKRIKRTIMDSFKVKSMPKENLDNLLQALHKLQVMIEDYEDDDEPSIVARIVNLFNKDSKRKLEEKETELLLEELASNKFFVATHIFNNIKGR